MPTYDYQCTKCKHVFEVFQSMSAKPIRKCPECNSAVNRLFGSGAGLVFKGTGFYETDYKKSGNSEKPNQGDSSPKSK